MPDDGGGPLERARRACGFAVVAVEGLRQPRVVVRRGWVPCAFLPAEVGDEDAREAMFARLMLQLELRSGGWPQSVARLRAYGPDA